MNIDSLRYFIELSRAGSFYKAAKSTMITQQGLNKAISSLENELNCQLVERSSRGVRLTHEGEVFLKSAIAIVTEHDNAVDEIAVAKQESAAKGNPFTFHVSYYAAQIAAGAPGYIDLLLNATYLEEPFDKLIGHALNSGKDDLIFLDLHPHSLKRIADHPSLVFEPVFSTRYGIVSREDSPIAALPSLHRKPVSELPIAINTFREMAQYAEWLFADTPLKDVRLGATSPRMLLEYVQAAPGCVAAFDSFGFFLASHDDDMPTQGLTFTPLATPQSLCYIGFLHPKNVRPSPRARNAINMLKNFLYEICADYFNDYPAP